LTQFVCHLCVGILLTAGLAGAVAATAPALAAEKSADLGKYCRNLHGPTAFANVDRRDNGLLCSIRTSGGLGLTHNKIKAADVCAKQQGTRRFRREGQNILCLKSPGDAGKQAGRSIDLAKYCRKTYGVAAFLTRRRTDNKPMCTLRTDGGLGLRHHVIDTNALCGGGSGRVNNEKLNCGSSSADSSSAKADPNGNTKGPTGSDSPSTKTKKITAAEYERLRNRKFPPLKPEDIIDAGGTGELFGKNVKFANLKDCGNGDPKTALMPTAMAKGLDGRTWHRMGVSLPCLRLTGGKKVDFQAICQATSSTRKDIYARRSGLPICWKSEGNLARQDEELLDGWPGLNGLPLSGVCLDAYSDAIGRRLAYKEYSKLVMLVKYRLREKKVECFYMKRCHLNEVWNVGEPCGPELKMTRRNEKGGDYEEIEGNLRYYGGPVFLELDYANEQEEDSVYATLEWDDAESGTTGRSEILLSRTPEDATLYRSSGIYIEPWTPIADSAGAISSPEPQQPIVTP
jgi:hypothetical protein